MYHGWATHSGDGGKLIHVFNLIQESVAGKICKMAEWTLDFPKVIYRSIHMYALKHFGMVWRSLSLSISIIILRGPFEEQLGKLAMNIKEF
jgi:hypothetical protein